MIQYRTRGASVSAVMRQLARRSEQAPAAPERQLRGIQAIDEIVNRLDHGMSKAESARAIDKNPAGVRRLLTAKGNPELATVVAMPTPSMPTSLSCPARSRP